MIVTSITRKIYKVEMTDQQAMWLHAFLDKVEISDIDAVCIRANFPPGTKEHGEVVEVLDDLTESIKGR